MKLQFLNPAIPQNLPADLVLKINEMKDYKTKVEVLDAAYDLLTKKYRGYRIKTVTGLIDLVNVDVANMWSRTGFLHCTKLNFLLRILLLGSDKFVDSDIRLRWTTINFCSPHQYVQIRINGNQWVSVDLWGAAYGIKFGDHAHGFHSGTLRAAKNKLTN